MDECAEFLCKLAREKGYLLSKFELVDMDKYQEMKKTFKTPPQKEIKK